MYNDGAFLPGEAIGAMRQALTLIAALALLALASIASGTPTRASGGPLDCGPDRQVEAGAGVLLTCSYEGVLEPIPPPSIDWGDGTGAPCSVPLASPFTCGPHAYKVRGKYNLHVSVQSICPLGMYCICNTLDCGPCANMAGGEYCDDVSITAVAGVGGVTELTGRTGANHSTPGWAFAATIAQGQPPTCPPGVPPVTPTVGAPTAPSNVVLLGRVMTWQDNSDDEQGFLICGLASSDAGQTTAFERALDPSVTTFALPSEAPPTCEYPGWSYFVYAFNEQGLSASSNLVGGIIECRTNGEAPATSPADPTTLELPSSGSGKGESRRELPIPYVASLIVLIGAAGALGTKLVIDRWRA